MVGGAVVAVAVVAVDGEYVLTSSFYAASQQGLEKVLPPAGMITITYCKRSHQSSAYSYRKIGRYIENEHEVFLYTPYLEIGFNVLNSQPKKQVISTIQSVADEHQVQVMYYPFLLVQLFMLPPPPLVKCCRLFGGTRERAVADSTVDRYPHRTAWGR